jgi:tetratricopeptide (TPR) repeat protein
MLFLITVPLKYCFAVLKETARGNMLPPKIDERTLTGDINIVFKYWGMYVILSIVTVLVIGFAIRLAYTTSPYAILVILGLYSICAMFLLPAMIIVFATTGSPVKALNPFMFLGIVSRLGKSYFIMFFLLFFLYAAPGMVAYFVRPLLPEFLFNFVVALANVYYSIVMHHLMGYVVLQHHDDLGYEVEVSEDEADRISGHTRPRDAGHALLNRVNILIKDGKYTEAVKLVQDETGGDTGGIELAERYHNLLKMTGRTPEMLEHAGRYLEMLIRAGKEAAYRALYLECVAADPKYDPPAGALFRVASSLSEAGNSQAALEAYNRFIQAHPEDPMTPKAYLMAAQIFHEKMMSTDRAVKVLRRLIKSYPDHEVAGYATKYLRKLEQGA